MPWNWDLPARPTGPFSMALTVLIPPHPHHSHNNNSVPFLTDALHKVSHHILSLFLIPLLFPLCSNSYAEGSGFEANCFASMDHQATCSQKCRAVFGAVHLTQKCVLWRHSSLPLVVMRFAVVFAIQILHTHTHTACLLPLLEVVSLECPCSHLWHF